MGKFHIERTLPYSAEQLWNLVGDVELYPEFIPWITRLTTYNRESSSENSRFDADVYVGFKMLSEKFSTRVTRSADDQTIDMNLIKGPFRKLKGRWTFAPAAGGTKVAIDLDMEIKNPFIDALFRANYDRAVVKLLAVFEQRAAKLYS